MSDMCWEETRQSEVCYFDTEVVVQENVVGFYITVNDVRSMEIGQCTCGFYGNVQSNRPWQCTRFSSLAVKMISDSSVGNVLVYQ